jgi:NitT/TauT family transport system substrate-binding protein
MAVNTPFTFYLDWITGAQFAGLFWASENGLYEAAGLDVTLVPWQEDGRSVLEKVIQTSASGALCAGCCEDNLLVSQASNGGSLRAFGAMLQDTPLVLMSRPEQGIRTIGDLRGKRIGMHPDGIRALETVLTLEGIPILEVDIHEVGFDLEHVRQNRFDAVQGYSMTEPVQLAELGVTVEVFRIEHPRLKPYAQVYFSERTLKTRNKFVLASFLSASNAGWLSVCADPDGAAVVIARAMHEPTQETEQRQMIERLIPLVTGGRGQGQIGTIDTEQWRRNLETYADFGLIDRPLDLHDVVFNVAFGVKPGVDPQLELGRAQHWLQLRHRRDSSI